MAEVSEAINIPLQEVVNIPRPIFEPLNAPEPFTKKLVRFGENYDLSTASHLYRFLLALCGDAGAANVKRNMLYPRLQSMLESTQFGDLDRLYGNPIGLPRLKTEIYQIDPRNEIMTEAQWADVKIKDAQYRARCLTWMRAIIAGPTPEGLALAAEAASGYECTVHERYKYIENAASDIPITFQNFGQTDSYREFIVVPHTASLSQEDRRRIVHLCDRLKPVNSVVTVATGNSVRTALIVNDVAGTSHYFRVNRYVTGRQDIRWPTIDPAAGYWVTGTETEAPNFAFMDRSESVTYLTIVNATATSEHQGPFNREQSKLFGHLDYVETPDTVFNVNNAYAKSFAPVTLTTPWTTGYGLDNDVVLVNNLYPIGYFAEQNIEQVAPNAPRQFWASREEFAPHQEILTFDLGRERPVNFIDFEISQKPIDIKIEYQYPGTDVWFEAEDREDNPHSLGAVYRPSEFYPWSYQEAHFKVVKARYLRLTFTRRAENFPFTYSEPIRYSIEVRNLRLMHVVSTIDEFIEDVGTDILGNSYRTDLSERLPSHVNDGDVATFWQSQANPSRQAVESLYFDLTLEEVNVTMQYLDTRYMIEVDEEAGTWDENAISPTIFNIRALASEGPPRQITLTWDPLTTATTTTYEIFRNGISIGTTTSNTFSDTARGVSYTIGPHNLPAATITVDDARDFASAGQVMVGDQLVTYTSKSSTTLNGCTGGVGAKVDGTPVVQVEIDLAPNDQPSALLPGMTAIYHVKSGSNQSDWIRVTATSTTNPAPISTSTIKKYTTVHRPGGQVVDEVFIDPLTFGPSMHFYHSVDDDSDFDNKLWTPVPRHYTLRKGYHKLPQPTYCKYFKVEFSDLAAAPYQTIDYPALPPVRMRKYPTWVQNYFSGVGIMRPDESVMPVIERVFVNPLAMGFRRDPDRLDHTPLTPNFVKAENEIRSFIDSIISVQQESNNEPLITEAINFYASYMFQFDLVAQLDIQRALSRFLGMQLTGANWNAELPFVIEEPMPVQSAVDLTPAIEEKKQPIMWFPRKARHGYQIVMADRPRKVAYFVSIRDVTFHRRDLTATYDEPIYSDNLEDDQHTDINEFERDDWRFVVDP